MVSQTGDCLLTGWLLDTITQQGMVLTDLARILLFSHPIFPASCSLKTGNKCCLIYLIFSSTSLDGCRKPELDWLSDCCCWRISISPSVLTGWESVGSHSHSGPVSPGPSQLSPCSSCYQQVSRVQ